MSSQQQDERIINNNNNNNNLTKNKDVINRIEEIINDTIESLDNGEVPTLSWDKYNNNNEQQFNNINKKRNKSSTLKSINQSRSFTSIYMILQYVHTLLLSNRTTTTREVYYFFVTYFKNQKECDNAILDTAKLLGVSRIRLGLSASPKGWYCGCVIIETITHSNNDNGNDNDDNTNDNSGNKVIIDGRRPACIIQGIPITREWIDHDLLSCNNNINMIFPSTPNKAKCILVIEKEGIYTRLSEDKFYNTYPCILITGRGFPDIATRALVYNLYHALNKIPVIGICDCNPFGISVLMTYISGSERLGLDQERYCVPMHWFGLRPSDVMQLLQDTTTTTNTNNTNDNNNNMKLPDTVFQKLTILDKKRIKYLHKIYTDECNTIIQDNFFIYCNNDQEQDQPEEVNLLDELSIMNKQGYKLELEALYWLGMDYFSKWLLQKLQEF